MLQLTTSNDKHCFVPVYKLLLWA